MPLVSDRTRILLDLFVPQRRTPDPRHAIPQADRNLSGKTVVLTGGTDGIGRIVRLAVSSGFDGVTGTCVKEDAIAPAHPEARIDAKRARIAAIIDKALARWPPSPMHAQRASQ